jgi:hypothetical protein
MWGAYAFLVQERVDEQLRAAERQRLAAQQSRRPHHRIHLPTVLARARPSSRTR